MKPGNLPLFLPAIVLGLAHHVSCKPYDYGFNIDAHVVRRQLLQTDDRPFVVGGLGNTQNRTTLPVRQEIRQMEKDPQMWTLYMLGLSVMQYTDQSEMLSYYQIAGIHGVPYVSWDGVNAVPGSESTGYCTHSSILFLTWHRPYLALYEQVLYAIVQYIATLYADDATRAQYQAAADNFRIPYMDWAAQPPRGEGVLPESVGGGPVLNITGPNGPQIISHPLFTYQFNPLNASIFIEHPYDLWPLTVRSPTANTSSAGSNNTRVSLALNQNFQSIQQRLYNLFSNYNNYTEFSNNAWLSTANSSDYDSLENLHDTLHALMGLGGHMAWIPFSSFDPIFFLHHTMVDRVFALWQILNPDEWVVPTPASSATYTTAKGEIQDSQTALTPFYKDANGSFWTSDDVRRLDAFGYTYDDMQSFPMSSMTEENTTTQSEVKALINSLYSTSSPATLGIIGPDGNTRRGVRRKGDTGFGPYNLRKRTRTFNTPITAPLSVVQGDQYQEWIVNVHAAKQGLNGTFTVSVFFGDPPADTTQWAFASNLVGTMSVFASPVHAKIDMGTGDTHMSGTIPLTASLAQQVAKGTLASLQTSDVEPFLRQHLKYGIVQSGKEYLPEKVPGLRITVASSKVKVPLSMDELPQWGAIESHFDLC